MARPYVLSLNRVRLMADRRRAALAMAEARVGLALERRARVDAARAMGINPRALRNLEVLP